MGIDLTCDWKSGFVMDPSKKQRVGYLIDFAGVGDVTFAQDVEVFTPYNVAEDSAYGGKISFTKDGDSGVRKVQCVGVLESFHWGGGVGDPLCISAYISAESAQQIQAKTASALSTTKVTKLGWWVCNFDEENKVWYEESFPLEPKEVGGQLNATGGKDIRIAIATTPTKVAPNIDTNVFNLYFEVIPAADKTFALHFASSGKTKFVKGWGLKVGTNAAQAMAS